MNKLESNWTKGIKENWFNNHKATIEKISKDVTVINWSNGTIFYKMRMILDRNIVSISGDLGEAVYVLTEIASIEKIAKYDMYYFTSKLSAFSGERNEYDGNIALKDLRQWLKHMFERYIRKEDRKEVFSIYKDLKKLAKDVDTNEMWKTRLYADFYSEVSEYDDLYESELWEVGVITNMTLYAYLESFKMINSQLSLEVA